jgi:hypothetical protein
VPLAETVANTPSSWLHVATLLKFSVRVWSSTGSNTLHVIDDPFSVTVMGGPHPQL